jgi:serine protease Do
MELSEGLAQRYGYESAGGVVITETTPLGPASRRGIGPGAKILSINGEEINDPDDVRRVLRGVSAGEVVSLRLGFPGGDTTLINVRAGG